MRNVPGNAAYFVTYEFVKTKLVGGDLQRIGLLDVRVACMIPTPVPCTAVSVKMAACFIRFVICLIAIQLTFAVYNCRECCGDGAVDSGVSIRRTEDNDAN